MDYISYNWQIVNTEQAPALLPNSVFRSNKGLFESMLSVQHEVPLLSMHLARLVKGMRETAMDIPPYLNEAFLKEQIIHIHEAERIEKYAKVRLQVFPSGNELSFLLEVMPINEDAVLYNTDGLKVGIVTEELKEIDGTEHLKRISPKLYTSVSEIASANNWDDVLLVKDDQILESGTSNIFWVKDGSIYTPPVSAGCIEGVMRTYIISKAKALGYNIAERPLTLHTLLAANEVFLTNAVRRIKWVSIIDNIRYNNIVSQVLYERIFNI